MGAATLNRQTAEVANPERELTPSEKKEFAAELKSWGFESIELPSSAARIAISRHIRAGIDFINCASPKEIERIASANSNWEVLLRELSTPEAISTLTKSDPLASARLRGVEMKANLLQAEGGSCSAAAAAELLRMSRQGVDKRRKARKLIAVRAGHRGYLYPVWQFEEKIQSNLETVLGRLGPDVLEWSLLTFFLNGNEFLDGATPLGELRLGHVDAVLRAASTYHQHGAA